MHSSLTDDINNMHYNIKGTAEFKKQTKDSKSRYDGEVSCFYQLI
jgi:hypothetical protein